ncbi:MAG: DNA polymerase IV [Deinococcus-Thermus bacterium]|nr:DNA polymerase IV [Deinococcota bacterium]
MRRIVHVDADAFYAAVEQRDDPALRGRPVAVGSPSRRGVVMTASYEARRYGVGSAMPSAEAARRCPDLQFVSPRMDAYREAGRALLEIYRRYTDLVEPLALDEAYLDVTEPKRGPPSGTRIAEAIRREARDRTGLTVSAGVSYCKVLAKLASDAAKPDGLKVIPPAAALDFLADLPVRSLPGVGPRTAERLAALGVETAGHLRAHDPADLEVRFGKAGRVLARLARGEDDRAVTPDRPRKSVSSERTFARDRVGIDAVRAELPAVVADTARRASRAGVRGRVLVVKIKDDSHEIHTRQTRLLRPSHTPEEMLAVAERLLSERVPLDRPIRLLGVGLAALVRGEEVQPPLFPELAGRASDDPTPPAPDAGPESDDAASGGTSRSARS